MPWKTRMERDIMFNKEIKETYLQGEKAIGKIVKPKKVKNELVSSYMKMWL